jgi:hypothetical protein
MFRAGLEGKELETVLRYTGRVIRALALIFVSLVPCYGWGRAAPTTSIPAPSAMCRAAIQQAEKTENVPERLLDAIAIVESGRRDPISGAIYPWPWTINADGVGHFYSSEAEAVAAVQAFQAKGVHSLDVGCMQVNLQFHPDAFATLTQAFDPASNAHYAARFLQQLYGQTNAWPLAAAAYHSWSPDRGAEYAQRVLAAWGIPEPPLPTQPITGSDGRVATTTTTPQSRVAVLIPSGEESIRVMTMPPSRAALSPPANPGPAGRSLAYYRSNPIGRMGRLGTLF